MVVILSSFITFYSVLYYYFLLFSNFNQTDRIYFFLQAIIRHAKFDGMEEEHKKKIKELDEKERLDLEERRFRIALQHPLTTNITQALAQNNDLTFSAPLQEPQHPQPATTAQKVPNKVNPLPEPFHLSLTIIFPRVEQ